MEKDQTCCRSILVVEDDYDIRTILVEILKSEGYSTHEAVNGKEALTILESVPKPCLVLLDMMMPIMNGREFLDKIMTDAVLAPIPVLIVSAIADQNNSQGAVGFIKKPIDIDVVLDLVSRYCQPSAQSHPLASNPNL